MINFIDDVRAKGLREKSRSYMVRAFACDDQSDHDGYLIWSSLALELLGKSALASINPVLILETKDAVSALASIGKKPSEMIRTIGATEVYRRISLVDPGFSKELREFCEKVAVSRNIELHSGGQPFQAPPKEAWTRAFWHSAEKFLRLSKVSLEDWLSGSEAERGRVTLDRMKQAERSAAESEMSIHKEAFLRRTKVQNREAEAYLAAFCEEIAKEKVSSVAGYPIDDMFDHACPVCGHEAKLGGMQFQDQVIAEGYENEVYFQEIEFLFQVVSFFCPCCQLSIRRETAMQVAGIDEVFGYTTLIYPDEDPYVAEMRSQMIVDEMGN